MIFNCLTLFPEMFDGFLSAGLVGKAVNTGVVEIDLINFRDFSTDKHKRADDYPFGGGAGMLLAPQPLFDCFEWLKKNSLGKRVCSVYMSPSGELLKQSVVKDFYGSFDQINILCGHYEGVDQRVLDVWIDREISVGDYILSGGEIAAMVFMDAVMRYVPGFLSNPDSLEDESFAEDGLLEYPQYTRPSSFRGLDVPEVLLSGHHAKILQWQRAEALKKTKKIRPDLLKSDLDCELD